MTFRSDLQTQLQRAVADGMKEVARKRQTQLDRLSRRFAGMSPEEVKPLLAREWRRIMGEQLKDPDLTTFAEQLSAGDRIKLHVAPATV